MGVYKWHTYLIVFPKHMQFIVRRFPKKLFANVLHSFIKPVEGGTPIHQSTQQ